MRKHTLQFIIMMVFVIVIITPALAEKAPGHIIESRSEVSYADALAQARRLAIEKSIDRLAAESGVEIPPSDIPDDPIFYEKYIKSCEVIAEHREEKFFVTRILAQIDVNALQADLFFKDSGMPKLMVLIRESHDAVDSGNVQVAETEMLRLLKAKMFDLVDEKQLTAAQKKDAARMALAGDFMEAKTLGLQYGAEYIIIGDAVIKNAGEAIEGSGFYSIAAVLQIKIIHAPSGDILGSTVKQGVAAHINPLSGAAQALSNVVADAVESYIAPQILTAYMKYQENGVPLILTVLGVDSFTKQKDIVDSITQFDKVKNCRKQSWNRAGGLLHLDVRFKGNIDQLAEWMDQQALNEGKFYIEDITANKLTVRYRE